MPEIDSDNARPYTQANAIADILEWSKTRPIWQRHALSQLLVSGNSEALDLDELETLCVEGEEVIEVSIPTEILSQSSEGQTISLAKVHSVQGVNALAPEQELTLAKSGVTIVYGDNGSGKSGYCRILKHACRSRDGNVNILSNIDGSGDASQSATIEYAINDEKNSLVWTPEIENTNLLSQVSIFDSRSANTHVQAENNVAYTPFPMRVLEELGDLCDKLKSRLEQRIGDIQSKTPIAISNHSLLPETSAGKYLSELSVKSDLNVLELLCQLKDDENRRLETLRTDLSEDPQKSINRLKAQRQRISNINENVETLSKSISLESINHFNQLMKSHQEAKQASKLASERLFEASPPPQIGSDIWKTLWEAARNFSDEIAYPDKEYPEATVNEDLCVLCQQPLDEEAVKRRNTFEGFIKSTTKATEQTRYNELTVFKEKIEATEISDNNLNEYESFLKDELAVEGLATSVVQWIKKANGKLSNLIENIETKDAMQASPSVELKNLLSEFDLRIEQATQALEPEARQKLVEEKNELENRVKLGGIKEDIVAEIDRQKQVENLKAKVKSTSRTPITNKNKELSEALVTGALRNRFAREIEKLELKATPMELKKTKDKKAQSYFKVEFVGFPNQPLGEILSEGEHRCVALAAFLAELVTSHDKSGIVFDDPMSSLDHIYRERVARRLAEEAQHRQVVVFTHDLGFLFELKREAEALDIQPHYQYVKRQGKVPGHIKPELPMKAKTAPALVAGLKTELKDLKGKIDTVSETKRVILVKGIIEQAREAWDQVIADYIAPVLGRFDNQIKGNSLYKLLVLEQADVELITKARSRLSEDLHHAAGALNPTEVTHEQLVAEVDAIHNFIEEMKTRSKKMEKGKSQKLEPRITQL